MRVYIVEINLKHQNEKNTETKNLDTIFGQVALIVTLVEYMDK